MVLVLHPSFVFVEQKVLPEDNSFNWGAVLIRLLPWEQTQKKDLVMSVLKALAYNPSLAVDAPKWQPKVRAVGSQHGLQRLHVTQRKRQGYRTKHDTQG